MSNSTPTKIPAVKDLIDEKLKEYVGHFKAAAEIRNELEACGVKVPTITLAGEQRKMRKRKEQAEATAPETDVDGVEE